MNTFVSSIAVILVTASTILDAGRVPMKLHKEKTNLEQAAPGGFFLESEWVKVSLMPNVSVIKVPIGGRVELECDAVGSPPPFVRWYRDDDLIMENGFPDQNEVIHKAIGKTSNRFVIDCARPHHEGYYTCTGIAAGKTRTPAGVRIVVEDIKIPHGPIVCDENRPRAPRIISYAPTLLEYSGRDVTLPCSAIGNPPHSTYWIEEATGNIIGSEETPSRMKVLDNGELFIPILTWNEMGSYTCVVDNGVGSDRVESFLYPVKKA